MRNTIVAMSWRAALLLAIAALPVLSQTEYYNLDFNRPLRVEDAVPTERRSLEIQLAPIRGEALMGGARRWRADPLLSYGIASLTEVEVRAPVLLVQPAAGTSPTSVGLTSVGIGVMRALNTETSRVPGIAVSAEVLMPVGALAPPSASYGMKALVTKTSSLARLNVNGSYGTYSVIPARVSSGCRLLPPGSPGCNGQPSVPDLPCARVPTGGAQLESLQFAPDDTHGLATTSTACGAMQSAAPLAPGRSVGHRWFVGAELDHAFALHSTLIGADVFAEHLMGLSPLVDWSAELGFRHQWSPQIVVDAGVSRHFAGNLPSTAMTLGVTYAFAMPGR